MANGLGLTAEVSDLWMERDNGPLAGLSPEEAAAKFRSPPTVAGAGEGVHPERMDNESQIVRQRAAVVVIVDGQLALIRRDWEGRQYFLFPGGGVDPGETPEGAAVREAREELGWDVQLTGLVARGVLGGTREQLYYSAVVEGGVFGSGDGLEMAFAADGPDGSHTPVLVPLAELAGLDVRPGVLVDRIVAGSLGDGVVEFVE